MLGGETSKTISTDIIMISQFNSTQNMLMAGEVAALVGGSTWIHFCTFLKLPISGTHTIVGATMGFAVFSEGLKSINLISMLYLMIVWLISPILAGVISAALFSIIRFFVLDTKNPMKPGLAAMPLFYMIAIFLNLLSIHFVENSPIERLFGRTFPVIARAAFSGLVAIVVAIVVRLLFVPFTRRKIETQRKLMENMSYKEKVRKRENVTDTLKFYFSLNRWSTSSNSALQRRRDMRRRRLHFKAILPDNTQVYGAATLSVNSIRDELQSSTSLESIASENSIFQGGSSVSFSDTPFQPKRRSMNKQTDFRFRRDAELLNNSSSIVSSSVAQESNSRVCKYEGAVSSRLRDARKDDLKKKKAKLRRNSYQVNRNLRYQVININKNSGGILKRWIPAPNGIKRKCYSCPDSLFNKDRSSRAQLDPSELVGGNEMTSSISTNNQVWFSNPEIEQEEEYAKGRSYRQSLNVINQLKEDGEDRKSKKFQEPKEMGKRILFTEPTPAELELFRNEINKRDKPECAFIFKHLQILTACFAAFAHGGNDVSNAVGPLATMFMLTFGDDSWNSVLKHDWNSLSTDWKVSFLISNSLSLFGGLGISLGLWIWGYRVIKTLGEDLTFIVPSSGFTIEIGTALTVLLASSFGIPVSTTHCKVAAIVGVGYIRTNKNVDKKILKKIATAWVVTIPAAATLSAVAMSVLREFA
ncbi:sodium-dependent phosphate transporter 2-like isoform X2 [Symsagittifera roscoffensis]